MTEFEKEMSVFNTPTNSTGNICLGKVMSCKEELRDKNYETEQDFRLNTTDFKHIIVSGKSKTGKTTLIMKMIKEIIKEKDAKGKKYRILCLDVKPDWCVFEETINLTRYTRDDMKINPWKIPKNIAPIDWINLVVKTHCRVHNFSASLEKFFLDFIISIYEDAGVIEADKDLLGSNVISKRSESINFISIFNKLEEEFSKHPDDELRYNRLIKTVEVFKDGSSLESCCFGGSDGLGIDEFIGRDGVVLVDFGDWTLNSEVRHLVKGVMASYFSMIANDNDTLVVEEMYESFFRVPFLYSFSDKNFNVILNTHKLSKLNKKILNECDLLFTGATRLPEDLIPLILKFSAESQAPFIRMPLEWFAVWMKEKDEAILMKVTKD